MRKIVLTDAQATQVRDAIRAGNPDLNVFAPDRRMIRSLYAKGLTDRDGAMPRLTEDGKDVARQLKAHPRRRTFHIAEADDDRVLRVQPSDFTDQITGDGAELTKRPYPFFVRKDGSVGRQDFWAGLVVRVVGFQRDLAVAAVDLSWTEAWADPARAVGMYLVTSNESGEWSTHQTAIESITVEGSERPGED